MTNQNTTPVPVQPPTKFEVLNSFLQKDSVQEQISNAVAENKDSFIASVIDLYTSDTYLQNCAPEQVVMQAMKAAVMKLPVIKALGFAYIVPFKSQGKFVPQLQIGYKGLIQLAMRTGQYRIINADVVYEGEYKKANKLTGEFDLNGTKTSETVIGYFAHFEMLNGFAKTIYMTKAQVKAHGEKYSKSYNSDNSIWKTEFDKMALKTALRGLLSHWGYLSTEMMDAMTEEDKDVAEQVLNEVNTNGNKRPMQFENVTEATVVNETSGNTPPF